MLDVMTLFDTKYVVSIHALRFQRAMRHRHRHWLPWQGFNPRPPFPEGDAEGENAMCRLYEVSIHALRFQRAMHHWLAKSGQGATFQSTPSVSRGRCSVYADFLTFLTGFQSTPSVSRGRCRGSTRMRFPWASFNPRPPFPEGDAGWLSQQGRQEQGFNPRPPFPEGDALRVAFRRTACTVSIHALRFQRAMRDRHTLGRRFRTFQSTPSVSRGRCQAQEPQESR